MGFKTVVYETDAGTKVNIRVSDATIAAAGNTAAAGPVDDNRVYAYASSPGSKRGNQLNARGLRLGREIGTAPDTAVKYTFVPFFTKAAMDAVAANASYTIGGKTYTVRRKVDEA